MAYSEIFSFGHFLASLATAGKGYFSLLISLDFLAKVTIDIRFSEEDLQNLINSVGLTLLAKKDEQIELEIDTGITFIRLCFTDKDEMTKFESGLVKALNAIHDSDDE